jgi:protein-tyrosine phosphatase
MKKTIDKTFGTVRGLARLILADFEMLTGRLNEFRLQRPEAVNRVVFVCLGNICRSAYAAQVATKLGMPVASLGLSTTTGAASPDSAVESAKRLGVSMGDHRATDWGDFKVLPGDLFLVMEIRQAHEIRKRLQGRSDVFVALLGMWCSPPMPHLHDPFSLSAEYFDTCFQRVEIAVINLSKTVKARVATVSV